MRLDEARDVLKRAALQWVERQDLLTERAMCDAASNYHCERMKVSKPQREMVAKLAIPFGKAKGTLITEAERGELIWVRERLEESLADPQRQRFLSANKRLIDAINAELERR